jgi:hypothetical protein
VEICLFLFSLHFIIIFLAQRDFTIRVFKVNVTVDTKNHFLSYIGTYDKAKYDTAQIDKEEKTGKIVC